MMDANSLDGAKKPYHLGWKPHTVQHLDGTDLLVQLDAQFQIVTEKWNRSIAVPYIAYMPEKDRILMLVTCDYDPGGSFVLTSDDHGATWSDLRAVRADSKAPGVGNSLTYMGEGKILFSASLHYWFSSDYGETWEGPVPEPPASNGQPWLDWHPYFVDRDSRTGEVKRLVATGCNCSGEFNSAKDPTASYQAYIRSSTDGGRTWGQDVQVPQWRAVNEVALLRAENGDLIATCRTDPTREYIGKNDHYCGLGVSISKDDGKTWSQVNRLYGYGRHNSCMMLMPNGDIVMTYVVREGYPYTPDGFPQFGIEAVVSRDHGQSWDLGHRYILHHWVGCHKGPRYWWPCGQSTSTVLLPDGDLLTAFGTGYRCKADAKGLSVPRDVGLIRWQP